MATNCWRQAALCAGAVLMAHGTADAQIVVLKSANYVAGDPPTVTPAGTFIAPASDAQHPLRVVVDVGPVGGGWLDPWAGFAEVTIGVTPDPTGDPAAWAVPKPGRLVGKLPADLYVRARLQKRFDYFAGLVRVWVDRGEPAYQPCIE